MSDTDAATDTAIATAAAKPKRRRRPVYMFVPMGVETVEIDGDGGQKRMVQVVPDGMTLYEAIVVEPGQGQTDKVRDELKARDIDPTNVDGVIMFRSDKVDFEYKISKQTIFRFKG